MYHGVDFKLEHVLKIINMNITNTGVKSTRITDLLDEAEDGENLQTGPFYSYGDSTEFDVVNVDNRIVDDDEYAVYDDVGFLAHQGSASEENGVEGVPNRAATRIGHPILIFYIRKKALHNDEE